MNNSPHQYFGACTPTAPTVVHPASGFLRYFFYDARVDVPSRCCTTVMGEIWLILAKNQWWVIIISLLLLLFSCPPPSAPQTAIYIRLFLFFESASVKQAARITCTTFSIGAFFHSATASATLGSSEDSASLFVDMLGDFLLLCVPAYWHK